MPLEEAEIRKVNGVEVIPYREGVLPVVRLASFFQSGARFTSESVRPGRILATAVPDWWWTRFTGSAKWSCGRFATRSSGRQESPARRSWKSGRPVLILDGAAFTSGAVLAEHRRGDELLG